MKIVSIFVKNLKIVSRNWNYFLVLFICPILLILISGAALNSSDFDNIKVGIIDKDPTYDLDLQGVVNSRSYNSLGNCLYDLTNSKVSVCVSVEDIAGIHQIDVHLDNTVKVVEYYSRQFILENIFEKQTHSFERTSDEINSQITLYSTSINNAKVELENVRLELERQEVMLVDYQRQLAESREDFDRVYFLLQESRPRIQALRQQANQNQIDVNDVRQRRQNIDSSVSQLRTFLLPLLRGTDYNYVDSLLSSITSDLDGLEQISIDAAAAQQLNQEIFVLADDYEDIMIELDSIKATLDQLDRDLEDSIQRTMQSIVRVDGFLVKLNVAESDLQSFSDSLGDNKIASSFKEAFPLDNAKPVFFVFPIIVAIIITFTSLVLSNMFILKQVNQASYFRDLITPTWDITFLIADYLINLFFVAIQAIVLFLVGYYWLNITSGSFWAFTAGVFLASSIFIFIGMSISYLVRAQGLSMLLTIFLLVLLIILSDLLVVSTLAGPVIKPLIQLNPFGILSKVLKESIVLNTPFWKVVPSLIILTVILIMSATVGYISKKICRENIVQ